jgi:hypothetical protein
MTWGGMCTRISEYEPKTMDDVKRMRVQPRHGFRCPARMPASENPEHPHLHNAQCGDYAGHDGTHTLLILSGAPSFGNAGALTLNERDQWKT